MKTELSRRELKSAGIKLDILNSTVDLIGENSFRNLFVDEICAKAGISKVTFFKYFRQKEDILVYFMQIWCFKLIVNFNPKKYQGLHAVRHIFSLINKDVEEHFNLMLALISYITSINEPPPRHIISLAERSLLFPEAKNLEQIEILTIQQVFEKHLLEAIVLKEINRKTDVKGVVQLITSLFYGTALVAHINGVKNKTNLYDFHIDSILKGLK